MKQAGHLNFRPAFCASFCEPALFIAAFFSAFFCWATSLA
eukprot:CAMPEP_0168383642 /NCGR_PEP_ID=MMETSP0228-20121227/14007_1 /TAXON_ID=133427 /ORGANISM="Protoceratium reticulatum, Strain CCCM 535 (=CCMP 1889)" /LENGTH=39 /DNA_ID= /DNA_START= /DNA_END= /DNA_ORIENTATION=